MTHTYDSQDTFDRDTEFRDEEHHLEVVVGSIDATIQYREGRGPVLAGDVKAANIVQQLIDTGLEKPRSVRNRPYFGRVDYAGSDGDVKSIYIGDVNIDRKDSRYFIASRNAPIAKLYYRAALAQDGFLPATPRERALIQAIDNGLRRGLGGRGEAYENLLRAVAEAINNHPGLG